MQRLRAVSESIQSFTLRADISPSVGALYGGELTDYATIRGFIVYRKPEDIRIIGLDPVLHTTTIFDMVSTGRDFRVSIPSKNRFIEGDNDAPPSSTNKLENLRPSAFLTSLLIAPPAPKSDMTLLENDTDESKAIYILLVIRQEQGELHLVRNVYFDRYSLEIVRQKTFTPSGEIVSETRYADWKQFGEASFPTTITIRRPLDGYEVVLDVIEMHANSPEVTDDKFVLAQPAGSQLERLK